MSGKQSTTKQKEKIEEIKRKWADEIMQIPDEKTNVKGFDVV